MTPFFPDRAFGWAFYLVLVSITLVAAYVDLRRMIVPKWISLPTLVLGIVFNLLRGGWLGYDEARTWLFEGQGILVGLIDGLLFSLAGFLVGFGLFFVLWILGTCGGGDVKLCASVGAWVGPRYMVFLVVGTLVAVIVISLGVLLANFVAHGMAKTRKDFSLRMGRKTADGKVTRKRMLTFSLPVALATSVVLLWLFRFELLNWPVRGGEQKGGLPHAQHTQS